MNTLWFLALLISLSGAALATLEREFVSRHISMTQNKEHLPELRGRIRAMLVTRPYAFIGLRRRFELLSLLHLSLFLFLAGVLIYFFNINLITFMVLVPWVGQFVLSYALVTVWPLFRPTELFYTPFSPMVFELYVGFLKAISKVLSLVIPGRKTSGTTRMRYHDLSLPYREGFIACRTKSAEKEASKPSQEIDTEVLERMLLVLDSDHALEGFFGAIPAFCDSRLVHKPLDLPVMIRLQQTLDAFLDRTFSSHLVTQSVRNDRLITCLDAAHSALGPSGVSKILDKFFNGYRGEALKSVEIGHSLVRWGHSSDDLIGPNVRRIVACIIAHQQDRDDRWAKLIKEAFDMPDGVNRDYLTDVDSVSLAILIHITQEALPADHFECHVLEVLSQFDIRNTSAELRHDFCALWNEIIQEARNEGNGSTPTQILAGIHHLFTALHQGTDSAPIRFPAPISDDDSVSAWPWSYRLCNIASHHPNSSADNINPATTSTATVPSNTQLGDSQIAPLNPTLQSRLPLTASRDLAAKNVTGGNADISVTSGIADLVHGSNSGGSSALQQAGEAGISSLPTPIQTPALNSANSDILPGLMQTDHDHHLLGAPSSISTTIPLSVAPQVATVSDQYPDIHDGTSSTKYDNQDTHFILSEDHRQLRPGSDAGP